MKMPAESIAFVFPGQGSQQAGMLAAAYKKFSVVRDTFEEASQTLGYDLWALVESGPQEMLNLTENTQPLMLTASVALWRVWRQETDTRPRIMAGHSLGEFSALVCASSIEFTDAVTLVRQRGQFMQEAVPIGEGAMAAIIGIDDAIIIRVCTQISQQQNSVVSAVNFNSPGQVVIAGHVTAVELATTALKEHGAKRAIPLPVSAPFHTELMKPAGQRLAEVLRNINISSPSITVVHNVHAKPEQDPEKIRSLLIEQISSPVQWTGCMQTIIKSGAKHIVECGPGTVLAGLNRRIDKTLLSYTLEEPDALMTTAAELG
jgi:[acyl-carrier-protein] S-malonyltransferase